jgi:hypothetical protein
LEVATADYAGHLVTMATDARAFVSQGDRFNPVDRTQVVKIFRPWPLEA